MTVMEFFREITILTREIRRLEYRIEAARMMAQSAGGAPDGTPRGKGTHGDRVGNGVGKITALEADISDKAIERDMLRRKVRPWIELVSDPIARMVLEGYYLEGSSIRSLSQSIGYERTALYRVLDRGREQAAKLQQATTCYNTKSVV